MENFRTLPTTIYFNPNETLQISKAELLSEEFSLAIDILNMGEETVNKITISVKFKNFSGEYLFNGGEFYFSSDVEILPHSKYYLKPFSLDERFSSSRSIDIRIASYNANKGVKKISMDGEVQILQPIIPEKKLEKIKEILGPDINTYGENLLDYWRCICGAINPKDIEECRFCKRNKNFVLNNLTEALINSKIVNEILQTSDKSVIEMESLERNMTRSNLTKVAPTKESITKSRINDLSLSYKKTIKKTKNIFNTIFKILLALLIFFGLFLFGRKIYEKNRLAKAEILIEEGDYTRAENIYKNIIRINPSIDLSKEFDKANSLIKSDNYFKNANREVLDGNYIEAVKSLNKVIPQDEKNFTKAGEKLEELEDIILQKAIVFYQKGDKDNAISLIKSYIQAEPLSVRAENLLKDINTNKNLIKVSEVIDEDYEKSTDDANAVSMKELAGSLLNTYQKVTMKMANLRKEADADSDIITTLPQGSELYIEKTKIEGSTRVWCYVQAKNIENEKSYYGWISNKVLMP